MKRREQQAEYDRVSEIHKGRLESTSSDATDANTVRLYPPVLCYYSLSRGCPEQALSLGV